MEKCLKTFIVFEEKLKYGFFKKYFDRNEPLICADLEKNRGQNCSTGQKWEKKNEKSTCFREHQMMGKKMLLKMFTERKKNGILKAKGG